MAQPGQNTTLSTSARLFCYLGPPSAILVTFYLSPKAALLSPVAFIPTVWGYKKWQEANAADPSRRADLESLVWTYALTATLGLATASIIQAGIGYGIATLLYGNGEARSFLLQEAMRPTAAGLSPEVIERRAEIASSLRYTTLYVVTLFTAAGAGEELLKVLPILYARRRGTPEQRKPRNRAYLDYAIASSLAFGVVEGLGFLYSSCVNGRETGSKLALTLVERFALGSSGHILMAVLSALRATRRDYYGETNLSWWKVLGPSIFVQ